MVNLGNMMKQAQQLQKKMAEAQNKLNDIEVEGTSGGGLIKVTATAKGIFKRISIDDSLIKQDEKEILEDLIVAAINDAKEKGGVLLVGGEIPKGMEDGNWMMPTVISAMTTEMRLFREETFGPIAPFMSFETDEEVLRLANDTEFGLASYIFTNNSDRIHRFSEQLAFGEVQVNGVKYAIYLPHGGIKNSGIGHDCSHLALEDYLVKKRVSVAL